MTEPRIHYAARRLVGRTVIGTFHALCGAQGSNTGRSTGHRSEVTCKRCLARIADGRTFIVGIRSVVTEREATDARDAQGGGSGE